MVSVFVLWFSWWLLKGQMEEDVLSPTAEGGGRRAKPFTRRTDAINNYLDHPDPSLPL